MKIFRTIIAALAFVLTIYAAVEVDYKDLSWNANQNSYRAILLGTITFLNMMILNRIIARKRKNIGSV